MKWDRKLNAQDLGFFDTTFVSAGRLPVEIAKGAAFASETAE